MINITENKILKITQSHIDSSIKLLTDSIVINGNITNQLKNICNLVMTSDGLSNSNIFQLEIKNTFKNVYDNGIHNTHSLNLTVIDKRKNRNNEYILLNKLLCFSFVIKIMSAEDDEINDINVEKNISIFLNDNFTFNNSCPHFVLFITEIPNIKNSFCQYKLCSKNNIGLIYQYIPHFDIVNNDKIYKINNLSLLIDHYCKNKNVNRTCMDNILHNIVFQIIFSLCGLAKYKINHYDFRTENILIHRGYLNGQTNVVDNYKLIVNGLEYNFYIPNLDFKIKIIDFGLSSSSMCEEFINSSVKKFSLVNSAGIYPAFSDIYDIHNVINEILIKLSAEFSDLNIFKLLNKIINKKYIGTHGQNNLINSHWRLGFPFTIKNFIKLINENKLPKNEYSDILQDIILSYDENNKLIVTDDLKSALIKYILFESNEKKLDISIINGINDPFDNNQNMILTPIRAIQLFTSYMTLKNDNIIQNTYVINLDTI
jgi:hypothetical protein